MTASPLVLAVPSKGRLQEQATDLFRRVGLPLEQAGSERTYRGRIRGLPGVEVAYLSASEIARELAAGAAHLGITGLDLVRDKIAVPEEVVELLTPLGFGPADVVVAIPRSWIDVHSMADLADVAADFRARHGRWLRVATKYKRLTRAFFAEHGVVDYRIVESSGATEGAPAAGAAELIVDITTTGQTLQANALEVIPDGVILKSEAYLAASLTATWSEGARAAAAAILDRLGADAAGRSLREVRALVPDPTAAAEAAIAELGATAPFGIPTSGPLTLYVAARKAAPLAAALRERGATTVVVSAIETAFSTSHPLVERLAARLGPL